MKKISLTRENALALNKLRSKKKAFRDSRERVVTPDDYEPDILGEFDDPWENLVVLKDPPVEKPKKVSKKLPGMPVKPGRRKISL